MKAFMSVLATAQQITPAKRSIGLSVADPARLIRLVSLLEASGYSVETLDDAEVVLSDSDLPRSDKPVVVLGVSKSEHAGVLPSDATAEQIIAAIEAVATGLTVRAPSRTFSEWREASAQDLLTPRELQVLAAIGDGASNKAIARQLGISLHTVKFHIESVFRKLGVRSRAEAVAKGLERVRDTVEI